MTPVTAQTQTPGVTEINAHQPAVEFQKWTKKIIQKNLFIPKQSGVLISHSLWEAFLQSGLYRLMYAAAVESTSKIKPSLTAGLHIRTEVQSGK